MTHETALRCLAGALSLIAFASFVIYLYLAKGLDRLEERVESLEKKPLTSK